MPVTDEQATALRAFLAFDPVYERLTRELAAPAEAGPPQPLRGQMSMQ